MPVYASIRGPSATAERWDRSLAPQDRHTHVPRPCARRRGSPSCAETSGCWRAERSSVAKSDERQRGRQRGRRHPTPTLCMQLVPGRQQELNTASTAQTARLGSIVGWVHARPAEDLVQVLSTSGSIESYAEDRLRSILSGLAWVREPLPASIRARLNAAAGVVARGLAARRMADSFRTGKSLVLLHGDPAGENILWAPDPVLIDWEYARLGDPADEIAYLFDQNGLTAQQREAFWRGYRHGSSVAQLSDVADRASWWEPATLLGSTRWWVERCGAATPRLPAASIPLSPGSAITTSIA